MGKIKIMVFQWFHQGPTILFDDPRTQTTPPNFTPHTSKYAYAEMITFTWKHLAQFIGQKKLFKKNLRGVATTPPLRRTRVKDQNISKHLWNGVLEELKMWASKGRGWGVLSKMKRGHIPVPNFQMSTPRLSLPGIIPGDHHRNV